MALNLRVQVDLRGAVEALEDVEKGMGRRVREAILEAARPILTQAIKNAPYDEAHRGWASWNSQTWKHADPGHVRDALEIRTASYGAAITTSHPGGPAHEFGGTISPSGHPITIDKTAYAERAGDTQADRVEAAGQRAIDVLLREHGY